MIDTEGQQALDALFYAHQNTAERYSAQETLREQGSAYITLGTRLISNQGRLMARITAGSSGRHDTLAGCCSCESNAVRFGEVIKSSTPAERTSRSNFDATAWESATSFLTRTCS